MESKTRTGVNQSILVGQVESDPTIIFTTTGDTVAGIKLRVPDPLEPGTSIILTICASGDIAQKIDTYVSAKQFLYVEGSFGAGLPEVCQDPLVIHINDYQTLRKDQYNKMVNPKSQGAENSEHDGSLISQGFS
ncbi:MAG: hypothetical protein CL840_01150 [Crocinitomicaceae bacterium]|jgi:Single-strand binding protein family.|nr:hypothetical protein [Crocinitomicaceae bacterium]|tara:strand:+ start:57325 stop:57726 length:402 start_codon:yes stop_codon:yes gene_type:complete